MADHGHKKNIDNLAEARDFAIGWGPAYQPSNPLLSVANLTALITAANAAIDGAQTATTPYRNATAACEDGFRPLSKLTRRIMKAVRASGAPESFYEDAATYSRKIQGRRKTPVAADDPSTPDVDESQAGHSASQMSRSQRIENLENLRLMLESQPLYGPNEDDLKTQSLKGLEASLRAKVAAVGSTFVPYSNSLASRDDVLYLNEGSVVEAGRLFKLYVESAFGRSSTEWQQVRDLEFKDRRRS